MAPGRDSGDGIPTMFGRGDGDQAGAALELGLADEAATARLGARLAGMARPGDVLALSGPLGVGKSALARAFVRALAGAETEVPSPTFTLAQDYATDRGPLWHLDLYRLNGADEVLELGWDDMRQGIVLVEWPDRLGPLLPAGRLDIALGFAGAARRARLSPFGDWPRRLAGMRSHARPYP